MVPAFDKVVFSCPVLEPTGPLHTQFGYHIIKVLYRNDKSPVALTLTGLTLLQVGQAKRYPTSFLACDSNTFHIGHVATQLLTHFFDCMAANRFVHIAQLRVINSAFGNRPESPVCSVVINSFSSGTQA